MSKADNLRAMREARYGGAMERDSRDIPHHGSAPSREATVTAPRARIVELEAEVARLTRELVQVRGFGAQDPTKWDQTVTENSAPVTIIPNKRDGGATETRRGRPNKRDALTPAERQRASRARRKAT